MLALFIAFKVHINCLVAEGIQDGKSLVMRMLGTLVPLPKSALHVDAARMCSKTSTTFCQVWVVVIGLRHTPGLVCPSTLSADVMQGPVFQTAKALLVLPLSLNLDLLARAVNMLLMARS